MARVPEKIAERLTFDVTKPGIRSTGSFRWLTTAALTQPL